MLRVEAIVSRNLSGRDVARGLEGNHQDPLLLSLISLINICLVSFALNLCAMGSTVFRHRLPVPGISGAGGHCSYKWDWAYLATNLNLATSAIRQKVPTAVDFGAAG